MKLAIISSHPIQYYSPIFSYLARSVELKVFYGHRATEADQARAGFKVGFEWDLDLFSGYDHVFLDNVAINPELGRFGGVDTPSIGSSLRHGRYDVVLVLGWHLKCFVQALWAAKQLGLPVMVRGDSQLETPRILLKRLAKKAVYPMFLRQFNAALTVGKRNEAYWRHYRYPETRMFRSPHCVDTKRFAASATPQARQRLRDDLGISVDTPVALFAGKLVAFKRPQDLITAAAATRRNGVNVEVMIAGSGPLEAELRHQATALDVPLHVLGFCNQSAMPAAYAASDVLVLPSTARETWGLVANEAIACGTPILVSNAAGCAPDMAGNGRAGRIYPVGDITACSAELTSILTHPPSASDIRRLSDRFTIEAACRGIVEALQFVMP